MQRTISGGNFIFLFFIGRVSLPADSWILQNQFSGVMLIMQLRYLKWEYKSNKRILRFTLKQVFKGNCTKNFRDLNGQQNLLEVSALQSVNVSYRVLEILASNQNSFSDRKF